MDGQHEAQEAHFAHKIFGEVCVLRHLQREVAASIGKAQGILSPSCEPRMGILFSNSSACLLHEVIERVVDVLGHLSVLDHARVGDEKGEDESQEETAKERVCCAILMKFSGFWFCGGN